MNAEKLLATNANEWAQEVITEGAIRAGDALDRHPSGEGAMSRAVTEHPFRVSR